MKSTRVIQNCPKGQFHYLRKFDFYFIENKIKKLLLFIFLLFIVKTNAFSQWTNLTSGTTKNFNEIFFPVSDTGYVVGENGIILRTFNGGTSWTSLNPGTTAELNDVFFLNSHTGFIVGDSGFFASTNDCGNSWTSKRLTHTGFVSLSSICFTTALIGYAGGIENSNDGIIFKTIDGGVNWVTSNTPTSINSIDYNRIVFPVQDTGYAITRLMCVKTVDAGNNWFTTDTALVNSNGMYSILEDAFFFSVDTGYIVGWYIPFCGYTVDGYHWADQNILANQWKNIDFPSRQVGYMIGWSQLAKTINGGQTWTNITSPLVQTNDIESMDFTDNNTGYACGKNGMLIKTTNGGATGITTYIEPIYHMNIYPNPSKGKFNLIVEEKHFSTAEINLTICNSLGEKIYQKKVQSILSEINLSDYPKGMYLVSLNTGDQMLTQRIVIE